MFSVSGNVLLFGSINTIPNGLYTAEYCNLNSVVFDIKSYDADCAVRFDAKPGVVPSTITPAGNFLMISVTATPNLSFNEP